MGRDLAIAGVLWVLLTVAAEAAVLGVDIQPLAAAEEAEIVDGAFRFLMILGAPVFTFVVTALVYSVFRFRSRGEPGADGPPLRATARIGTAWLAITSALALFVIVNPGLVGLAELRGDKTADMVVRVEGFQWGWRITYPDYGISTGELVLPVDRRVKFEVTSRDVVHSFWVPAFRMKIDAVPGITTTTYVTPNELGTYSEDSAMRLQCAELCGLAHFAMRAGVSVVDEAEFDAWVAETQARQQKK